MREQDQPHNNVVLALAAQDDGIGPLHEAGARLLQWDHHIMPALVQQHETHAREIPRRERRPWMRARDPITAGEEARVEQTADLERRLRFRYEGLDLRCVYVQALHRFRCG